MGRYFVVYIDHAMVVYMIGAWSLLLLRKIPAAIPAAAQSQNKYPRCYKVSNNPNTTKVLWK